MADVTRSYRRKPGTQIAMTEDHWKLFLLQGTGLILLGIAAAILPNVTTLAIGALMGWLLLISGLFRLASGFAADIGPGHWSSKLLSALMVLFGAVLAFYSNEAEFALSAALAGYLVIHAIASLILALSLRKQARTWLAIVGAAVIDVLLATFILARWPSMSPWVFGLYLGINLVVGGLALLFVALDIKSHMRGRPPAIARKDRAPRHPYLRSATRKDNQHHHQKEI